MEENKRYDRHPFMKDPSDIEGYGLPNDSSYYGQTGPTNPSYPGYGGYGNNPYTHQSYPIQNNPYQANPQGQNNQNPMVQSDMPTLSAVTGAVGGAYQFLDKGGYLDSRREQIAVKVPNCIHSCYKKVMDRKLPKEPFVTRCGRCGADIQTELKSEIGVGTIGCSALFCLCIPQLFWCPFVIDDCYDHSHRCTNCQNVIMKEKFLLGNP